MFWLQVVICFQQLTQQLRSQTYLLRSIRKTMSVVLGLMSGTSLDGLDLCCVRFADNHNDFQILAAQTVPYSLAWKSKLENAFFGTTTEVDALDKEYGVFFSRADYRLYQYAFAPPY